MITITGTQRIEGVLFDLDGTLVDSLQTTFDGFNHALARFGVGPLSPPEIIRHFGPGEGEIFGRILGPEHGPERASEAYRHYHDYTQSHLARVPLHPGVEPMLEEVWRRGLPAAIVTGRSWRTTELILRHHGLLERFVTVVANDHVSAPKPSPEGLHLALSRLGLTPAQTLYLGDSWVDVRAAKLAGMLAVGALWDWMADRSALENHAPDHLIATPAELVGLLGPT